MKNYNNLNFEKDKIINYYKFLIYLIPAFIVIGNFYKWCSYFRFVPFNLCIV